MVAASEQTGANFRRSLLMTSIFAVIVLALYLWGFFAVNLNVLNLFGITSFLILMLSPVFVAVQAIRLTLDRETALPPRDQVRLGLRYSASWLLIDALVAVPIFTLLSLFLQMEFVALFSDVFFCGVDPCRPGQVVHLEIFTPQSILVMLVAIGLWGLNLLACIVAVRLAQRWRRFTPAISGTILVLTVTVATLYAILSVTALPQILLDLVVALLPYFLAGLAWLRFTAPAT